MSQKLVIRTRLVETRLAVIYRKFNGLDRISRLSRNRESLSRVVCINPREKKQQQHIIIKWNLFGFSKAHSEY